MNVIYRCPKLDWAETTGCLCILVSNQLNKKAMFLQCAKGKIFFLLYKIHRPARVHFFNIYEWTNFL